MEIALLLLSVLLGAGLAHLMHTKFPLFVKYLLAFSGAFVFSLSILHIFPELFAQNLNLGPYVLVGFFLQLILEFFSKGLEHGHLHHKDAENKPFVMILALWIHAFLEGMPISAHGALHDHGGELDPFLSGILFHKVPIGMIFFLLLKDLKMGMVSKVLIFLAFAFAAPMGSLAAEWLPFLQDHAAELMALVMGILLHISTTILFESSSSHQFNKAKLMIVIGGALLAWVSNS